MPNSALKILFITHFFSPRYRTGTDIYTLGIAQRMISNGHMANVLCAEGWNSGAHYWNGIEVDEYEGVSVQRIHLNWQKAPDPNRACYDSPQVEDWLEKYLLNNRPDIVHVTSTYTLGAGVLRAVKKAGIPLVLTLMDFWFICPRTILVRSNGKLCDGDTSAWECQRCMLADSGLFRFTSDWLPEKLHISLWESISQKPGFSRMRSARGLALDMHDRKTQMLRMLTLPDKIISHSAFLKSCFEHIKLTEKIDILPLGQDLTWLEGYPGKSRSDVIRFGFIGQISQHKGLHILVDAFRKTMDSEAVSLNIWGNPNQNPRYAAEINVLIENDPRIKIHGQFSRQQLGNVFSEIDVLIVPSLWYENSPLVIQEAFATGTPVIASNLGGMAEALTHEKNGLLFEPGNVPDLTRQINRFLSDETLLHKLIAGISPVKTIDEEVSQLEDIYLSLISYPSNMINGNDQA